MDEVEYLIAGGGPTGLGAAHKLMEHDREWMLCEGANQFGGLAASVLDENGYTWDLGGHVLFSHYDEFGMDKKPVCALSLSI
jgi:protoporphyrinogen oxidase